MDEQLSEMLARRAASADVSAEARERVLSGVRPRRRWVRPVLAASVAVAATVAGVAFVARDVPLVDPAPPGPSVVDPSPSDWRTEYWHDVQVEVPADWWFGGSPLDVLTGSVRLRGRTDRVAGMVSERSPRQMSSPAPGYVGRPIAQTDACEGNVTSEVPVEPYLWFDAPIEPGVVDLGEGWTQETAEVNGSTITVATQDRELLERIIGSASGGETCLANRDDLADPLAPPQPTDTVGPLVCAYQRERGEAWLTYAAPLSDEQAQAFVKGFEAAPSWLPNGRECDLGGDDEWVTVHLDESTYVVRLGFHGCPHVGDGDRLVRLTPELVEPWLVGGVPTVLYGPTGGKGAMIDSYLDQR